MGLSRLIFGRSPAFRYALGWVFFVRLMLPLDLSHPFGAGAALAWLLGPVSDGLAVSPLQPMSTSTIETVNGSMSWVSPAASAIDAWVVVAAGLWILGVAVFGGRLLQRFSTMGRLVRSAAPIDGQRATRVADSWRRRFGVRRRVRFLVVPQPVLPFTSGWLRPVVVVPATVLDNHRLFESVVAHELAHVARFDALWLRVQQLVQVVYFFNPLVWFGGARLAQEREILCDARVLGEGVIDPRLYAGNLLDVAAMKSIETAAPAFGFYQRSFSVRITSILESHRSVGLGRLAPWAVAVVVGLFLLPLAAESDSGVAEMPNPLVQAAEATEVQLDNPLPEGRVTWAFKKGRDPFSGEEVFHRGIDVAAKAGTAIQAPAAGTVEVATTSYEPSPGSGTVVVINHGDDFRTFYAHLESVEVNPGQRVNRGDLIATVGSTGRSTGPHLHFEIRRGDQRLDPADFVTDWR